MYRHLSRIKAAVAVIAALCAFGFAGQSFAQAKGDHLVISNLDVPDRTELRAGVPYQASVDIDTPSVAVEPQLLCFFWNREGPICFKDFELKQGADGTVRPTIGLKTGRAGKYRLTAVMTYGLDGATYQTNQVWVDITVR